MDPVTHTLTGALIGQAGLKRRTGLAMPALIIGANLPDIDVACFLWLDGVQHLGFRRGITHGPIAWVLLPLLLAGALWWFDRWQARRGTRPEGRLPLRFGWLYALSFIACLTHPALDWLNVYGIRLLEPFSSRWFYGDTLFIIDVWLWAIMGLGLWFSLRREQRGGAWRRPAQFALATGLAYISANYAISSAAYTAVPNYQFTGEHGRLAIVSPPPVRFWERETLALEVGDTPKGWKGLTYNIGTWNVVSGHSATGNSPSEPCALHPVRDNVELDAFVFWSRAPFAERAPDGSMLIRDARYYNPRARNRFTVALPGVRCEPIS